MSSPLPPDIRQLVAERAGYRCEYCLLPDGQSYFPHQVDHIIAIKHGGASTLENLALACIICNKRKGSDLSSYDPETGAAVPLYHPRRQRWSDHFRLEGAKIQPLTATGRVTVTLLQVNQTTRLAERKLLQRAGRIIVPE
jgi:hypothetical protein